MRSKYVYLFVIQTTAFICGAARAGTVGNGGDAIVCPDGRVMMLDHYEGEKIHEFNYRWPENSTDATASALAVAESIAFRDPEFASFLSQQIKDFIPKNVKFLKGIGDLKDIPDSEHIALPKGCEIKQLVIQKEPHFPEDRRYNVNADLYDAMPVSHQGAMILHEVLYTIALSKGHLNSINTRYLAAYLASTTFQRASIKEFVEVLALTQIRNGLVWIHEGDTAYRIDTSAPLTEGSIWDARNFKLSPEPGLEIDVNLGQAEFKDGKFEITEANNITIPVDNVAGNQLEGVAKIENGRIVEMRSGNLNGVRINLANGCTLESPETDVMIARFNPSTSRLISSIVHLRSAAMNGQIAVGLVKEADIQSTIVYDCGDSQFAKFRVGKGRLVEIRENGNLRSAWLFQRGALKNKSNVKVLKYEEHLAFTEDGLLNADSAPRTPTTGGTDREILSRASIDDENVVYIRDGRALPMDLSSLVRSMMTGEDVPVQLRPIGRAADYHRLQNKGKYFVSMAYEVKHPETSTLVGYLVQVAEHSSSARYSISTFTFDARGNAL